MAHLATHVLVALLCMAVLAPPVLAARSDPVIKAGATSCLGFGLLESPKTLIPVPLHRTKAVCVRYQFKCSKEDPTVCTNAEAAAGTYKWGYAAVEEGACEAMQSLSDAYKNVFCCSTNNCNRPDLKLDKATRVVGL